MAMDAETTTLEKDQEPVCSVCIANFNGGEVLEACLESVLRQDFTQPVEILVHDDASTDGSADIVSKKYPGVRLIRSDTNVGFCVSNNRMVAQARGKYIMLLNNDAELHQNALSTLYNYSEKEKLYGIIGLPQYNKKTGELIDVGSLLDPFLNPIPNLDKLRSNVAMVIGACMWLRKQLWDELGGFPEWFESIAEDMYLCCLARLKGYPVVALAEAGFNHWVGKSLGGGKVIQNALQTTYRRRALSERNKSYVMVICCPAPWVYPLVPLHLLILTFEGVCLALLKNDGRIWSDIYKPCLRSLWLRRRQLFQMRKIVQKERTVDSRTLFSVHSYMPYKLKMLLKFGMPTIR